MAIEVDVAIVGGGMGGLALAIGLQQRGIPVHVFEKSAPKRKHFGTGMGIGENGIRALDGIKPGLSAQMESVGNRIRRFSQRIRMPGGEEQLTENAPQRSESHRMFTVTWKAALDLLVEELHPAVLHYEHTFLDYEVFEEGVVTRFQVAADRGGNEEIQVVKSKLLVGADGVWSPVRKLLLGDEPRDLWLMTWLSIIPSNSIRELHLQDDDEISFIYYPAKKTGMITCYCGSGVSIWNYRVPDKSGELSKSFASDLNAYGPDMRKRRLLKQIEGVKELQNLRAAMERSESAQIREDRNFDRLPVSRWSDASGRVVLLGDAAHGMYPGTGMGVRVAFEDAHQLALLLQEGFGTGEAPKTAVRNAIKRFEEVRIPRCTRMQAFAAELTSWPCFVPAWVQQLSPADRAQRAKEFYRWVNKYPADSAGDPDSTYWKPEQDGRNAKV